MKALQHRKGTARVKDCNQVSDKLSTEEQGAHDSPKVGVCSEAFFGLENMAGNQ